MFKKKVVATEEKKGLPSETYVDTTIPQIANFSIEICKHLSDMVNNLGLDEKEIKVIQNRIQIGLINFILKINLHFSEFGQFFAQAIERGFEKENFLKHTASSEL